MAEQTAEDKKFAMSALLGIACFVILYIAYRYLIKLATKPKRKKDVPLTNKILGDRETDEDGKIKPLGKK